MQTEKTINMNVGKWIPLFGGESGYTDVFMCSNCKKNTVVYRHAKSCDYNYCPRCGALMCSEQSIDKLRKEIGNSLL